MLSLVDVDVYRPRIGDSKFLACCISRFHQLLDLTETAMRILHHINLLSIRLSKDVEFFELSAVRFSDTLEAWEGVLQAVFGPDCKELHEGFRENLKPCRRLMN